VWEIPAYQRDGARGAFAKGRIRRIFGNGNPIPQSGGTQFENNNREAKETERCSPAAISPSKS